MNFSETISNKKGGKALQKSILILTLLALSISIAHSATYKKCSRCEQNFPSSYQYCPKDGAQLTSIELEGKDIDGFQEFKWGESLEAAKRKLKSYNVKTESLDNKFTVLKVSDFKFQGQESLFTLTFFDDGLYKLSVHFKVDSSTAGMNRYFSFADIMSEVYGETKRVAIGRESDDYNHRVTQISIGKLNYQFNWKKPSGTLTYQLSEGPYRSFLCSLFYASNEEENIDKQRAKSEF